MKSGRDVTGDKTQAAEKDRAFAHREHTARDFPQRMTADVIGFSAIMKLHAQRAVGTGAGAELAVMKTNFFRKRARLPTFHARRGDCDPINRAAFDRNVTADFFK